MNKVSLVLLGLMATTCVPYTLYGAQRHLRKPAPQKVAAIVPRGSKAPAAAAAPAPVAPKVLDPAAAGTDLLQGEEFKNAMARRRIAVETEDDWETS